MQIVPQETVLSPFSHPVGTPKRSAIPPIIRPDSDGPSGTRLGPYQIAARIGVGGRGR